MNELMKLTSSILRKTDRYNQGNSLETCYYMPNTGCVVWSEKE
jgi:hypothetical protein